MMTLERRTARKCCLVSFLGSLVPITLMLMARAGVVLELKPGRGAFWFYSVNCAVAALELLFAVSWFRKWFPRVRPRPAARVRIGR